MEIKHFWRKNWLPMTRLIPLLLLVALISSCKSSKLARSFSETEFRSTQFLETIPFEQQVNLLFIEVLVNGKKKRFMLDTGAPNVISQELADELSLPILHKARVKDSQGASQKLFFAQLDSLQVGTLTFYNSTAVIADLSVSPELSCLNVDGLLGSNVMREAIWQFDFEQQEIRVTDNLDSLAASDDPVAIPFYTPPQGTPVFDISIGQTQHKGIVVDLGSNGGVDIPLSNLQNLNRSLLLESHRGYGATQAGLYGSRADTTYRILTDSLSLDTFYFGPSLILFSGAGGNTIGNKFWNQFQVTIDWQQEVLLLEKNEAYQPPVFETFGFLQAFRDDQLLVGFVYEDSPASRAGLRVGDRLLFANGMDMINFRKSDYCRFFINRQLDEWKELDLLIEQNGTTRKVKLEKETWFNR
jgi:hypothetical protein